MLFECGSAPRAIGERAFGESDHPERNEKPPSIGQIQIPARHVYIGRSAFGFCPALEYASFETVSSQRLVGASAFFSRWYGADGDRFPCRADWVGAFQLCRALRFVPLGYGDMPISSQCWPSSGRGALERIEIPACVVKVGVCTLYHCESLKFVPFAIGSHLETIEDCTFAGAARWSKSSFRKACRKSGNARFLVSEQ